MKMYYYIHIKRTNDSGNKFTAQLYSIGEMAMKVVQRW